MDEYESLSHTKWECKYHVIVCYERNRCGTGGSGASPKMRVGPSKSVCRNRLQTASSCVGQVPSW
jgi:hypothetical protein